ncbi:MAG: hypothetical protein OWQ54_06200 [Sulfolobaceae archaeon]|nr:hypothetical protein [Sulfolobaceae archaeon]
MPKIKTTSLSIGIIAGIVAFIWAYIHLQLTTNPFVPAPFRTFFLADSILAIIAGILLILTFRLAPFQFIYILELVYWWINYLLLGLTRILPAPLVGRPLPVTSGPALYAFIVDIVQIILTTYLFIDIRR